MADRPSSLVIRAEQEARTLLRACNQLSPPTDVDHICRCQKIQLVKEDLEDNLSGMSFVRDSKKYIIVNKNHHVNRRRFTIAHEIGHHALHHEYLTRNIHVDTFILNRDTSSANGNEKLEIEANAFAAELLMPMAHMKSYLSIEIIDDSATRAAAKNFRVSQSAFTYRLLNIGNRVF